MRNIYVRLPLLLVLFVPAFLFAQQTPLQKKSPKGPVIINTRDGVKTLPLPNRKQHTSDSRVHQKPSRKTVAPRKTAAPRSTVDYDKVLQKVTLSTPKGSNARGSKKEIELPVYYPKKASGLRQLKRAWDYESITLSGQADVDNFNTAYPGATSVGSLVINGPVNNISSLAAITDVGYLAVKNTSLTTLGAFTALTGITDSLVLENNNSLTAIGLSGVTTLGGLMLRDLPLLTTVDDFGSGLTDIANDVRIERAPVSSLEGLSGIVNIGGDLRLISTDLESPGLSGLRTVGYIWLDDNSQMNYLGLSFITKMNGMLLNNLPQLTSLGFSEFGLSNGDIATLWLGGMPQLTDISYVQQFSSVANLIIMNCDALANLDACYNIGSATYGIFIYNNNALQSISGLGGITSVAYDKIEISSNGNLFSLDGLQNITETDALWITDNYQLTSLDDLNSGLQIYNAYGEDLQILYNPNLETCSVPAICNYLNSGNATNPQIYGNSGDCYDMSAITQNCGVVTSCDSKEIVTWNGEYSSEWSDPGNWTPNRVPGACDIVVIPSGTSNDPSLYEHTTIGGLVMEDSYLYLSDVNLTITDSVNLYNSTVYDNWEYGYSYVKMLKVKNPKVTYSYFVFLNGTLEVKDFTGAADIYGNSIVAQNVIISDAISRSDRVYFFGNDIQGSLTYTNNSSYGNNYLSNGNSMRDHIYYGDLTINNNAASAIVVGIGENEPLWVEGHVTINQAYMNNVYLDKITFSGGNFQQLNVPQMIGVARTSNAKGVVTDAFSINYVYFRKYYGSFLVPQQHVMVNQLLVMGSDRAAIASREEAMLIINNGATVTDEDPENGSYVEGPMKKIGNTEFTFPLGKVVGMPMFTGNNTEIMKNAMSKRELYGDFKALLSISAPSEANAEFVAEYKRSNLQYDGYDPGQHEAGIDGIIGDEYWILTHPRGSSDVAVTLSYDRNRVEVPFSSGQLNITGWDGSKWISHPKGATSGDNNRGTVSTASPITTYGPLAFFAQNIRTPILTIQPLDDTIICKGSSFYVHFTLDTAALEGTIFRVVMSDENGDFSTDLGVGSKTTFVSDSILLTIPASWLNTGGHYLLKITGDRQAITSQNTIGFTVAERPQVTVSVTGPTEVCLNEDVVKYYPSEKEAGVTYTWSVTGGTVTVNNDTAYVTFTAAGNRTVTVTPVNNCGNGTAKSQTVLVKPGAPVTTPTLTHTGRRIYASTPPPAEQVTAIRWYRNGSLIAGETGNTYYASEAGTFTAEFVNDCGSSPVSNTIVFENASLPQTITFNDLQDKTFGDEPFELGATASSGLPVSYQLVSGIGNMTQGVFTITQTGTVTIKAYQLGNNDYDTAVSVTRSFTISKGTQSIEWDPMPDYIYKSGTIYVTLPRYSSGGIPITYTSTSPNIILTGYQLQIKGLGSVTITATQAGDNNHLPAAQVTQTFCVRVTDLTDITGAEYVCPGQEAVYRINKIAGLEYHWRLSDGTTLSSNADTVKISWATTGTYKLYVYAAGPCGPATATDSLSVTVMDGVTAPVSVTNMLPSNGSTDHKLPLLLSWIPGSHTLSYDIFIWENGTSKPANAFATNITTLNYTITTNAGLTYGKTYNWQVISKNGCLQTAGPVQTFRLRTAPDLAVTNVTAPLTVNSGQKITITWKVKNIGAGDALTHEKWSDAVFLSFDTLPAFSSASVGSMAWGQLQFPVVPLLVGTKANVSSLNAGQEYTNSIDFNVPLSYSQPLYVYVVANYKGGTDAPPDSDHSNDTLRQQEPINVVLTPTPDLRVDTLLIPATTFSGSKINVTYKVKNYGALTPAGSRWNDKIYISKSPLFVKKNAIQLEFPNQNEMYYPATKIEISNSTLLQHDSSVTKSVEVIIPNFISGTWFIHVVANDDQKLYEGALAENNETNKAIQILLTPTPQFTISSLNVPFTGISTTQTIGINWNVLNSGFFDNIEKNKGYYGGQRGFCGGGSSSGWTTTPFARDGGTTTGTVKIVPNEFDSLSWGSSYWIDRVYLSADPSGLNTGTALLLGEIPKGIKDLGWRMPLDVKQNFEHCADQNMHGPIPAGTTSNVLRPQSNHPNNFSFKVPANLPDGDYYFYVQTNATKTVFTYVDTPVVRRSSKVTISRPDLTVTSLSVPANLTGGTPFNFEYTVSNIGAGSVYDATRTDSIFMSNSPVFDASATFIKAVNFTENVLAGTPVTHLVEHTLPNDITGAKYFFVKTNATRAFLENNFNNNTSAPAMATTTTAAPADLIITQVLVADSAYVPGTITLNYTVQNNGANTAKGATTDSIYISCDPVFNQATSIGIGSRITQRNLLPGSSVTDTVQVSVTKQAYLYNTCFVKDDYSKVYFYIKANTTKAIYEAGDTTNNVGGSGEKTVTNKNVDLVVTEVSCPDDGLVGRPYAISWTLANNGMVATSTLWGNRVMLTIDSTNLENAVLITSYQNVSFLNAGQSAKPAISPVIPKVPTGDYYIVVEADYNEKIKNEIHRDNNMNFLRDENGKAKKIHIVQPLLSDLTSEIISAPSSIAVGQPLTIKYKITNTGEGMTYPDNWNDYVFLSTGLAPTRFDVRWMKPHRGNLQPNDFYEDSLTVIIPMNTVPGNYMLTNYPDYYNAVIEENDTNNIALQPITVYVPEPVDLVVQNVSAPDTVYLGYPVDSVRWHVQNNSSNSAEGISTDGIYLSKNPVYDSSAILIGLKNKKLAMTGLTSDTLASAPVISNVPEGNYYIIVRTDILNNIPETDKTNNEGVTPQQVYVSVKELKLDETLPDTMSVPKYYKLNIPDSLLGATVLLTLKSEDSLTQRNEMYVGGGYIPSVIQSDYKFNTPNYGNQDILISDITQPVYYIAVRPVSPGQKKQNISLHAVKLPFAVLMSQTNRGGNGGNVTVKLTGSLFTDSMTAKLSNGSATIIATNVYFINSTVVYATFPLQGKPIGVYDVVLTKTDMSEAVLDDGFSVVSPDNGGLYATGMNTGPTGPGTEPGCDPGAPAGLNSQLITELVVPEKVFAGWPFVIQINYSNPTNMDIPVQTKVLYNDYNVPMAFSKDDLAGGTSSLFIEIKDSDGLPGVIRAGSSGSITIYSNTPPNAEAHDRIKFNLK